MKDKDLRQYAEHEVMVLQRMADLTREMAITTKQVSAAQFHAGRADAYAEAAQRLGRILGIECVRDTDPDTGKPLNVWTKVRVEDNRKTVKAVKDTIDSMKLDGTKVAYLSTIRNLSNSLLQHRAGFMVNDDKIVEIIRELGFTIVGYGNHNASVNIS